jgi:hypothetical protein
MGRIRNIVDWNWWRCRAVIDRGRPRPVMFEECVKFVSVVEFLCISSVDSSTELL